jgi:putative membrane protein
MTEKNILRLIAGITAVVFGVVITLKILPPVEQVPSFTPLLPRLNACINAVCSVLLVVSYIQIRRKNIALHKRLNIATFVLSSVFLVSYVIYHYIGVETKFPTDNPLRSVYLFILLSHIVLAAVVFPLILLSFYRGLTGNIPAHKRLTRWAMPMWLYVTVTGVVVYLMISPYYTF